MYLILGKARFLLWRHGYKKIYDNSLTMKNQQIYFVNTIFKVIVVMMSYSKSMHLFLFNIL
jgi:hypothetical protein